MRKGYLPIAYEKNEIRPRNNKRLFTYLVLALLSFSLIISLYADRFSNSSLEATKKHKKTKKRKELNVIFMISDGFGPASETFGRVMYQRLYNSTYNQKTPLDELLVGQSRTRSADSLITDSAAGATAFSCAAKTYNSGVAVDPNGKPCATLLEAAHDKGMLTGMVVTSRATHATPAAFSSHSLYRNEEDFIATWIGSSKNDTSFYQRNLDLVFGGGYCHFLPNHDERSCRKDNLNLIENSDYYYFDDRESFDALDEKKDELPIMGLFTPDHMSFEIDRDPKKEPGLWEMTEKALNILSNSNQNKKGFFLMIEGSKIDMAAHNNDAAGHFGEINSYYKTIEVVKKFARANKNTLVISVSDHETGGLSLGYQPTEKYPAYIWYPEVIEKVNKSIPYIAHRIRTTSNFDSDEIVKILEEDAGLTDITEKELTFIIANAIGSGKSESKTEQELGNYLAKIINVRANLGWSTHGHSGVDVNLYAYGPYSELFKGNHENEEIGGLVEKVLGANLKKLTKRLFAGYEIQKSDVESEEVLLTPNFKEEHYHH